MKKKIENNYKISLINLGKVSKPIEKLIDAIQSGIGVIFEPTKIVRKAKAEAQANLIRTKSDIEEQGLRKRSENRRMIKEVKRQRNIESIIDKSIKELPKEISSEKVDEDWISFFFENCQDISKSEMQEIWGKILAKEVSKPNSFSLRTIQVLKLLSSREAQIFNRLSKYLIKFERGVFFLNDPEALKYLRKNGNIFYTDILALKSVGLIEPSESISLTLNHTEPVEISFFGKNYLIHSHFGSKIRVELLSLSGQELYNILNIESDKNYKDFVFNSLDKGGINFKEVDNKISL